MADVENVKRSVDHHDGVGEMDSTADVGDANPRQVIRRVMTVSGEEVVGISLCDSGHGN
jgi:hypothetical protein